MQRDDYVDLPTFRQNHDTLTTIDYIFVGIFFSSRINDVGIDRLRGEWTDYHVLHASIKVGLIHSGPGLWRAHTKKGQHKLIPFVLLTHIFFLFRKRNDDSRCLSYLL
jgi:hypothetical protein